MEPLPKEPVSRAVLDTNVFVAAGFRPRSAAGACLDRVRAGRLIHVWSLETRAETDAVLARIPRLAPDPALFPESGRWDWGLGNGALDVEAFAFVPDPADRKFAALAAAAGVPLVSNDSDLLDVAARIPVPVLRSSDFLAWLDRA